MFNVTNAPNGFLKSSYSPFPHDTKLLKLKTAIDNSISKFHSKRRGFNFTPRINNISTQGYPSILNRFAKNSDVKTYFSVFYLFFPQTIIFCVVLMELVRENELNLKKYMILYGLSKISYWISWTIISNVLCSAVALEIIILGKLLGFTVFINSNPLVPFLIFYCFGMSMQFLAYFLSCIIKHQKTANTVKFK